MIAGLLIKSARFNAFVRKAGSRCLLFVLLMAGAASVQAGAFCSDSPFFGTIDGSNPTHLAALDTQITIDTDCTFLNFPASNPLTVTLNFQTNDPSIYLIIFDNVVFTGNMACANIDHKIWFSNGSDFGSNKNCQDLFIPVETINKVNPSQTTVGIGEEFTYTLTLPYMQAPIGDPSPNELWNVIIGDKLDAASIGAELTYVSINAYFVAPFSKVGDPVTLVPETGSTLSAGLCGIWTTKNLCYEPIANMQPGDQIVVEITVKVDDVAGNTPGTQFINTAKWWFGREIDIDDDGVITPDEMFTPLPGEWGVTGPMTIGEPNLTVTKSSPDTALNITIDSAFTIDVQNTGGSNAWQATIVDQLPAGMCDYLSTPTGIATVSAEIFQADGTTSVSGPLTQGVDYSLAYAGDPTCTLTLVMLTSTAVIGPTQRLIITYTNQLDGDVVDGSTHTNVAGVTQWFSGDGSHARTTYNRTLTNGTTSTLDHEDAHTITAALSGYIFQKTVTNVTTSVSPATTAAPGDTLRYRLRMFNFTEVIDDVTFTDTLDPNSFDLNTFNMTTGPPAGATFTFNNVTGLLQIIGNPPPLNLTPPQELVVEFEITLLDNTFLSNNDVVQNKAFFNANGPPALSGESDDPFVNGIAAPGDPGDFTEVVIQSPGPLNKFSSWLNANVGQPFIYTIQIPATPVDVPLYDVRIIDDLTLSDADLSFVSANVLAGGSWTLTNTGTAKNVILEDTSTGIDIPANGQATIQITVQLDNSLVNQEGLLFDNEATYTYNRVNGNAASQTAGQLDTTPNMVVREPHINTITKTADNTTPTAGDTVRYSVTMTANGSATSSDVFDVTIIDTLDLGLVYAGNPTVTVGGGVSAGNTIGDPDVTGDGITTAQTLVWGVIEADIDIVAGTSVTVEYDVLVLDSVLGLQTLNNSVVAEWTSVDGSGGSERDGSDGIGGLNDYITVPVVETLTTPDVNATINKVRSTDTFGAGDDDVRIGDIVEYTLTINADEGTMGNLQLVDTLPQGLDFEGVVSINGDTTAPYSAVAPFAHTDIAATSIVEAGDPNTGPTTVTWSLGNVTNQPNDGLPDNFVIVYRARVLNSVFTQVNSTALNNTIDMTYDKATGPVSVSDIDTVINLLQPNLVVSKSAAPAGGDIFLVAGELVTYTVDVQNTGLAPAYDPVIEDVIPVGMRNGAATVTMVSTELLIGGALPNPTPVYNAGTGLVTWNLDTGVVDQYTIPAGDTLRMVYQVQVDAVVADGLTLTNQAQTSSYYSFDDEAVPTLGAISGTREVYSSNTASTTLYTSSPPSKALISPAPGSAEATIGEEIIYQITVPGTVSGSTLFDVSITDILDTNLEYVSATITGGVGVTNNSTATQMDISVDQITAGTQVVIELHTRIRNILAAQQGVDIDNTVSYNYAFVDAGPTQPTLTSTDIVTVNIVEPNIGAITKVANNLTPTAGDIVRYTVTMTATGGTDLSDVFDVTLTDTLDLGLVYEGNPTVSVGGGVSADNTIGAPTITGDGVTVQQTLVWSLANGNADIDIVEGTVVTVAYDVRLLNSVLANQTLNNTVVADWTGIDGANAFERTGADGIGGLNDYITAPVVETLNTPNINATITKVRSNDTYGAGDDNVRIGDIVEYTLTLSVPEGTLGNLELVDTLPQGLDFEGVVSINGDTTAPYSAAAPFAYSDVAAGSIVEAGNPALGPTTVTWTFGNVTNLPNDGLADNFVLVYRARVMENVFIPPPLSVSLNNTIDASYATGTGTVTNSDIDTIITALHPELSVTKTAAAAGGDTVIVADEIVTYTINVINSGNSPAYDLVLEDIIPVGMRNGTATITMVSTTIGGAPVANLAPSYNASTGLAVWNFDTGVADAYTIGAGETMTLVYQAQADSNLSAGITLTNAATGTVYYSFDNNAVPTLGTTSGTRQAYGPTNTASEVLTSQTATQLGKSTQGTTEVTIGETFTYRITVPQTPLQVALHDVRITDDLGASAADITYVSVARVSGAAAWTPTNTGSTTNLVIEDTTNGIDIPAGDQAIIDVTVLVMDNATDNNIGVLFNNTANYTYNLVNNNPATVQNGVQGTSADITIVEPDVLTLEKSGPASMRLGLNYTYTLNVHNTGTSAAYDLTIVDVLPDPTPGGMCDTTPFNITAQMYLADGTTTVGAPLVQNTDYTMNFVTGASDCTMTFTMVTPAAAIPADHRLIITYDVTLDTDSTNNTPLTNIAAATQWFSLDTAGAGAAGEIRTYTRALTTGTTTVLDHEDAYTTVTESPTVQFRKYVTNVTTGQDPGANASPGDILHYRIEAVNVSPVDVPDFTITDDLGALNSPSVFVPGSITNFVAPGTADLTNTNFNGGVNGTGIIDVRNLSLDPQGGANDTVVIEFDIELLPVIDSGTLVLNQANLQIFSLPLVPSDDPNVSGPDDPFTIGDEQPTQTLIASAPLFQVQKISDDLTGSATVLLPGDTLRYTITVKNIGDENAVNATIQDAIPANTTYVAGSTTLNGVAVADPSAGVSAIESGMLINAPAPEITTPGYLRADTDTAATNVATITFDVTINAGVIDGTIISNQGFVNGDGVGTSGAAPQQPSDDPNTVAVDDPTLDVVGGVPLVDAIKTVTIQNDAGTIGVVDIGDTLRYTITVTNFGAVDATGVTLTDAIPADTTYDPNTTYLNNIQIPDVGATSALVGGIDISSSDLTPPLPAAGAGYLSPGESATVRFDVVVAGSAVPGTTIISNQGFVDTNELINGAEPTDSDGIDANGDQPTIIPVGNAQQLSITKQVLVVGGGPALAGGQLEYIVRVTNVSTVPASDVVITDDLDVPVPGQMTLVSGSATMNGLTTGVTETPTLVTADYGTPYGLLQPNEVVELRFRVLLDASLNIGDTVTNTAQTYWNAMTQNASASVSINIGAIPGVATLYGRVWHDNDFDDVDVGLTERGLENWNVQLYFRGTLITTVTTDVNGDYQIPGVAPNYLSTDPLDRYEVRFVAPGAGSNTALLGEATAPAPFLTGLQRIYDIVAAPSTPIVDMNLPIDPDGVIYDSIQRNPVPGARVRMLDSAQAVLPATCFVDPNQQDQVTLADGFYKFDINFTQPECPSGSNFLLQVIPPNNGDFIVRDPNGFNESVVIPPQTNAVTAPFTVPGCAGGINDAVPGTTGNCEVQTFETAPPLAIPPQTAGTNYHMHLTLSNGVIPRDSQLFNNHIPIDPDLTLAASVTKTTPLVNVTRGELVPYTITITNTFPLPLNDVTLIDNFPAGFKYVAGSARLDGVPTEPTINGLQMTWDFPVISFGATHTIKLLLIVGGGVEEGEYVNQAYLRSNVTGFNASGIANATVRVVPDPTFDCSDVIGKVYDDKNYNGYQDDNEPGIPGVRLATARGLLVTTDKHGRFHVTCAVVPDEKRGSNFIMKVDDRTLPTGYRITTENPRVQRVTRGKVIRFNFGATVHHVVTLSVADGVFTPDTTQIRPQWLPRLGTLLEELRKKPSILRITYMADVEAKGLVDDRIAELQSRVLEAWQKVSDKDLEIEKEIYWRHGGPVDSELGDDLNASDYISSLFGRSKIGEDTERQLPHGYTYTPWFDTTQYNLDNEPKFETKQVMEKKYTTKKLTNVVPDIPFKSGKADIPDEFVDKLRAVLEGMRDRVNVRLHFIGHTDNVKLRGALLEKYEDNMGLSKERAGTTAEYFQRALELPPEAISYEGMGETKPVASNDTAAGKAKNRRVEVQVWYDEVSEEQVEKQVELDQEIKRIMVCRVETVCKLRYKQGHSRRTKLKNLIPPFHYDEGVSEISAQFIQQLRQALRNLSSKDNVQMRFIGYTDNVPLTGRDARIYGDHVGLSKANSRRVAIAVQEALGLPNEAIDSTGKGSDYPLASNNSDKGRAMNRRIEVEFWHDDPLEDLPDEPQICPEAAAAETVERIYNPPEGDIEPIFFENGKPVVPQGYTTKLRRAMDDIKDQGNVRLRFIGYTSNKRLDRRTAMVYGDDIGLSTARAARAMEIIKEQMSLTDEQVESEGRGYVQSHDVVNTGFLELDRSKVEVQVVYDELAVLDENEGVSIKRLIRDVETKHPLSLNLMRISVDGQPLNDPNKNIPDVQRCTDVALDQAQVRFKFDNMEIKPRLNVTAWPNVITFADDLNTSFEENLTHFRLYTNYSHFIDKAEVRIFLADQSTRDTPVAVVPVDGNGNAQWKAALKKYEAARVQVKYVLRVYDKKGNFDETAEQILWLVDKLETNTQERDPARELLVGYGENRLTTSHIPVNGGTIKVYGKGVPEGHTVWFAGKALPVSNSREFAGEFIIPSGLHNVEVAITDASGNGNVYRRDLEIEGSDWFYVGIADITVSSDNTNGPAELVTQNENHYSNELSVDGRLAFYAKGKFSNEAVLTTSADTREGPVDELFTNFMNKTPEALFRRIDPDYYYPTFGDDSKVENDAPTSGKFYLKLQKDNNYGMWGNFNISYLENNLAHVDRALYGANVHYESRAATSFGEKQYSVNLFAAEPGTVAGRDEFLGTGGSLYYLRHQDVLTGSDRLRIEVRDAISGMVLEVKNLSYGLDYDIDYIQGRIMLSQPLSSSYASGMLVDSSDYGGVDVYLVARYEYTPGFDDLDDITTGGRVNYWFNDQAKLGLTMEDQQYSGTETSLSAYDFTYRYNAGTWVKLERSTSQGPVSSSLMSSDGGYAFSQSALPPGTDIKASGQRVDTSLRLEDMFSGMKGKFTFYNQELDAGYAAPGLIAQTDTSQTGGTLEMPVHEKVHVKVKADSKDQENSLQTRAVELNVDYLMDDNWKFGAGVRNEKREDDSPAVPLTQQEGDRSDVALRATYDSRENWLAYGYIQDTAHVSGNRDENGRVGMGGDYRITDRFKLDGELSSGDLGDAIKLGSSYKMTDATNLYSSYTLENERTDNGVKARKGNFSSGFKTRYSDSASIYMEERYTHGDVPTGITHAFGFDLALTDTVNFGGNLDFATLRDNNTGAKTERQAAGFRLGYKFDKTTYAGAIEYRIDETEQADTSIAERKTVFIKNSLKYQWSEDWRIIAKLNTSQSESSLGDFYNGNFIEAVVGYAFRPVSNDALNMLMKYTYFYNMPSADQVAPDNSMAEYIQKSQVVSVDVTYDLTRQWSLGGKYAYRFGELSMDRENPQFFDSDASLYIVRVDYHFTHYWDALVEGRMLDLPDAGDTRSGILLAIYRHFGDNFKLGAGYNFTDFSDDLTDLDYDRQGFFINVIGKF